MRVLVRNVNRQFYRMISVIIYIDIPYRLTKKLDGCYTRLLRYCLGFKWSDHVTNVELYGGLTKVSKRLLDRKLRFVGHCQRARGADQPIKHLLLWDHSNLGVLQVAAT